MSDETFKTIGIAIGILAVPFFWALITTLIARLSGWSRLAESYRTQDAFEGQRWRFESARFRRQANYSSCLTFGANARGLYLATLFLFRPGHPPLLIPWDDVTLQRKKRWMFSYVELRFRRAPGTAMLVRARLGERLAAAGGRPLLAEEKG